MLRTITYTVSADSISPYSPQFAGIQGENGATALVFHPDAGLTAEITALKSSYDSIYARMDCIDGAGRKITGTASVYSGGDLTYPLDKSLTEAGGRLKVCLYFSGVNNDATAAGTQLLSFPAELYFRDFPCETDFTARSDLNKAVSQVTELRAETYDIAQDALVQKAAMTAISDAFKTDAAAAETRLSDSAAAAAASAAAAKQSADTAAAELASFRTETGDINAALAGILSGTTA